MNNVYCIYRTKINMMGQSTITTQGKKCYMELSQILNSMNMPSRAYNEIIQWAQRSKPTDLLHPIGKKYLISKVAKEQGLRGTFPHTELLELPSGNTMKVTKLDFASQLMSILSEDALMRNKNLIHGGNLFKRAKYSDFRDDVERGTWFLKTQEARCKRSNDILCPIILYIDKIHIATKGIEAISFCLGKCCILKHLDCALLSCL